MLGMPVVCQAVTRSPQGMGTTVRSRSEKRTRRAPLPMGHGRSGPARRTRPPGGSRSSTDLAVPALAWPPAAMASSSSCAPGTLLGHVAGQAVGGHHVEAHAGHQRDAARFASASWRKVFSKTGISPVMSR